MPMKVRYTVVNGEVLSENRAGVERDYLPDTQGNVIGLLDSTQTITDTFSYFPYGEVASRTGTNVTPFQFLGTMGYYRDSASRTYVRARTLNTAQGRWMTQDPIGFEGGDYNLYRYVANRPTVLVDPSGLIPPALLPCLPCAACLVDLLIVCSDCKKDVLCWVKCIIGTIKNLPRWLKFLCGATCYFCIKAGCAALGRSSQSSFMPLVPSKLFAISAPDCFLADQFDCEGAHFCIYECDYPDGTHKLKVVPALFGSDCPNKIYPA